MLILPAPTPWAGPWRICEWRLGAKDRDGRPCTLDWLLDNRGPQPSPVSISSICGIQPGSLLGLI